MASTKRALTIDVLRGGVIESRHSIRYVITDTTGNVVASRGDYNEPVYMRSSAKPLICAAIVASGAADRFNFTDEELAIAAGSHAGQDFHVAAVRSMLQKIGLDEAALQCGPHPPLHMPSAEALQAQHHAPSAIYNNCSGKHAGVLALLVHRGFSVDDYLSPDNPGQREVLDVCADLLQVQLAATPVAVDGCGIPVIAVPMSACATFYARLSDTSLMPIAMRKTVKRVRDAMLRFPEYVGGTDRFDTDLMRVAAPRLLCKSGAEGFHGCAILAHGLGMSVKVEDGNSRAVAPFVIEQLLRSRYISAAEADAIMHHRWPTVTNYAHTVVGQIKPRLSTA